MLLERRLGAVPRSLASALSVQARPNSINADLTNLCITLVICIFTKTSHSHSIVYRWRYDVYIIAGTVDVDAPSEISISDICGLSLKKIFRGSTKAARSRISTDTLAIVVPPHNRSFVDKTTISS